MSLIKKIFRKKCNPSKYEIIIVIGSRSYPGLFKERLEIAQNKGYEICSEVFKYGDDGMEIYLKRRV